MSSATRIASLSLDLDNAWSYLKVQGDPRWETLPSYLDVVVPRILAMFDELKLRATIFVVGLDAAQPQHDAALRSIVAAGHEIGNHSYRHESWLHLYSEAELAAELTNAETQIERATGQRPVGFRGPGYSFSEALLQTLARRGYLYDASTLPTYIGPLARAYYFKTARLTAAQKEQRRQLFGTFKDGLMPLRAYRWQIGDGGTGRELIEIPVTTMPGLKIPFHLSYVLYLAQRSRALAEAYFQSALTMCRLAGVQPSLLLHPLDFLGHEDAEDLAFFPAMGLRRDQKLAVVRQTLQTYRDQFEVLPMREHAQRVACTRLPIHTLGTPTYAVPDLQW